MNENEKRKTEEEFVIDLNDCKIESKGHKITRELGYKLKKGFCWVKENQTLITTIIIPVLTVAGWGAKQMIRSNHIRRERTAKELFWYDPSLGKYFELKRKAKPSEVIEIDRRRAQGERLSELLNEFRLLK